ncbi:uncharacterized protein [Anser cygnoides]|uniref:uncharacterized protein n=1 Tax=Anser cygnoides TaxID=8845 RepID=UPI0034D3124D
MKLSLTLLLAMALAMASFIPGGLGLCRHRGDRVRVSRSLGTKHQVPNWPCSLGLSSCPSRIRLRLSTVVPDEGPKQQPLSTEHQTSDLPYPLGYFWEYLAHGGSVWMLCRNWEAICLLCVAPLAEGLWRRARRLRRQGTGRLASVAVRTDSCGKDALSDCNLLCRMEANVAFTVRCLKRLYQLRLQELGHPQPRKKVQDQRRKRRASFHSPANFI